MGKANKEQSQEICYKHKDGRFLKIGYMGDGEYELILTSQMSSECVVSTDWELKEILGYCDGVYDDDGKYISDTLNEEDLTPYEVSIAVKTGKK